MGICVVAPASRVDGKEPDESGDNRHCQGTWQCLETTIYDNEIQTTRAVGVCPLTRREVVQRERA